MPTTSAPSAAIGSEKLPRPQNMSAMRSPAFGASSDMARRSSERFIAWFTCVNSFGAKARRRPKSGSA
jgi:hypothetical protein